MKKSLFPDITIASLKADLNHPNNEHVLLVLKL